MITQTQWPVVRSEGWFALALVATHKLGSDAVVDCLHKTEVTELLKTTLGAEASTQEEAKEENDKSQENKDRDNAFILVKELLKNDVSFEYKADKHLLIDNRPVHFLSDIRTC
jgi:adenosyl cobinamide kinase/adenosyl cobinamide phosphate guanylyltransferase